MTHPTTFLLQSIWEIPTWRDDLLSTFNDWVQNGASRNEAKNKLKAMIAARLSEEATLVLLDSNLDLVNWDQMTEFLCLCFYRKRLRSSLPGVPPYEVWMQLSNEHTWGPLSLHPQQNKAIKDTVPVPLFPLELKLLTLGGQRMVYRSEPDLEPLLRRGEAFDDLVEFVPEEPHQCHANVARLWHEKRDALAIVTGYALSEDGYWRQHSWLIRNNQAPGQCRIIETASKRVKYFGFILTDTEAKNFYKMNG